jgi:hypothetical protein
MSLLRSEYSQLGLEFYLVEDNHSHTPKKPSIVVGKKAVMRQRDEMMDNFSHLLEGYLCFQFFFPGKRSPSHSSILSPMSNIDGKLIQSKVPQRNLEYMGLIPLKNFLWMRSKNNTIMLITMKTNK